MDTQALLVTSQREGVRDHLVETFIATQLAEDAMELKDILTPIGCTQL